MEGAGHKARRRRPHQPFLKTAKDDNLNLPYLRIVGKGVAKHLPPTSSNMGILECRSILLYWM